MKKPTAQKKVLGLSDYEKKLDELEGITEKQRKRSGILPINQQQQKPASPQIQKLKVSLIRQTPRENPVENVIGKIREFEKKAVENKLSGQSAQKIVLTPKISSEKVLQEMPAENESFQNESSSEEELDEDEEFPEWHNEDESESALTKKEAPKKKQAIAESEPLLVSVLKRKLASQEQNNESITGNNNILKKEIISRNLLIRKLYQLLKEREHEVLDLKAYLARKEKDKKNYEFTDIKEKNEVQSLREYLLKRDNIEKGLTEAIDELQQQIIERDSQLDIFRSHFRQTGETDEKFRQVLDSQGKSIASKNSELIEYKQENAKLRNKLLLLEQANRKILERYAEQKRIEAELRENLAKNDEESNEKDAYYPIFIELSQMENNKEMERLIKEHENKEVLLKSKLLDLSGVVHKQKDLLMEKDKAIKKIASELSVKSSEILLSGNQISGITNYQETPESDKATEIWQNNFAAVPEDRQETKQVPIHAKLPAKPFNEQIEDLIPMIDIALQNNEPIGRLKESLLKAGYSSQAIEMAISKIK